MNKEDRNPRQIKSFNELMSFNLENEFQRAEHTLVRVKARKRIAEQAEKFKTGEKRSTIIDSNADGGLI